MRKIVFTIFLLPTFLFAQFGDRSFPPYSWSHDFSHIGIPSSELIANQDTIEKLKTIEHASYICATALNAEIRFSDFQLSEILPDNSKIYRFRVSSPNALGLMVYFDNFRLAKGAKLWVFNSDRTSFAGVYSVKDNYSEDGHFLTSNVLGNDVIVEYLEPAHYQTPNFTISKIYHYFRGLKSSNGNGFRASGSCMINAACPEGDAKPAARDAACRILIVSSSSSGYCSGSLVNNTSEDRTPYILTANHCVKDLGTGDVADWEFDFNYASEYCNTPASEPIPLKFKGCTIMASSGSDFGDFSSDFLLVKLNSFLTTSSYDFTFLGWDRSDSNFWGNYCYHHPNGDIKKVSTSLDWTSKASFGNNVANTHLEVSWSRTNTGHSVTDVGSSGSALVNNDGKLIGTLTGGTTSCSNVSGIDLYGRFFMHWDRFGLAANRRVKNWLDPANTGATTIRSMKLSGGTAGIDLIDSEKLNYTFTQNNLVITWLEKGYQISIYNLLGQNKISKMSNEKSAEIDLSALASGIYIVEVISEYKRESFKILW